MVERGREGLKRILIECLKKEEGEAMPDRLLYAYQALKGLSKRGLLELAEGCDEIEVIRKRYYDWNDREVMIFLKLKGCGKSEDIAPRGRRAEGGDGNPPRPIRCFRCG